MNIDALDRFLRPHFRDPADCRPYDDGFLQAYLKQGPLHAFIPERLGGQETSARTAMEVMETTAYHSLPLGLTMGITGSLFLRPVCKLAQPALRDSLLPGFLKGTELGGMMITEPTGGTDIFGLQTGFEESGGQITFSGHKCWGGLTGRAEHWLVAARQRRNGRLSKRVALIYVPLGAAGMQVETYFDALGLQPIPYGLTHYDNVSVPDSHLITQQGRSALRDLYDILFRSRLVISAIAGGHCRRLAVEATERADTRITFGTPIASHDQVQFRLSEIRGTEEINRSFWNFGANWMDGHPDLSGDYLLINAAKVVASDGLATASDSAFHLFASAAFKRTHLVGRGYIDVRPFRIFEGVNDVLNENTFDVLAARHGTVTLEALQGELEHYGLALDDALLPANVKTVFPADADRLTQRRRVLYGDLLNRIAALAVVSHEAAVQNRDFRDGTRFLQRHLAARASELPYL